MIQVFFFNWLTDKRWPSALPALRRTLRVGEVQQSMTGPRQTIAVIITFRKSNENSIERRVDAYWSNRKNSIVNVGFGNVRNQWSWPDFSYRGADKSLARPGRKRARKHVRDARDFNNIETLAVKFFFFLLGKAPKEIHAILTETLACFLPGWAKDLSAALYNCNNMSMKEVTNLSQDSCHQSHNMPTQWLRLPLHKTSLTGLLLFNSVR